jgi:hypothetical protein
VLTSLNARPNYDAVTDSLPSFNSEPDIDVSNDFDASVYASAADSSSAFHTTGVISMNNVSVDVNAYDDTGTDETPDFDEVDDYGTSNDAPMLSLSGFLEIFLFI